MSEAGNAVKNQSAARGRAPDGADRVSELKVSGHLMTLDAGTFCIFHMPGGPPADSRSGLPGVRISLPPALSAQAERKVRISTFRTDGWLDCSDGAALVHVDQGPAQVLVTVYQSPVAAPDTAPRLQVLRLNGDAAAAPQPAGAAPARAPAGRMAPPEANDLVAHVQRIGDVTGPFGSWIGTRGSGSWIEGFGISPPKGVDPQDLEYQAVLGRGWLSPWIEGGKFCGSRGMALPLLGLNVRLKGEVAKSHDCSYSASFVDGTSVGPVPAGEACQSDSLAALEAIQVILRPRGSSAGAPQPLTAPATGGTARKKAAIPAMDAAPPKKASTGKTSAPAAKQAPAGGRGRKPTGPGRRAR